MSDSTRLEWDPTEDLSFTKDRLNALIVQYDSVRPH